MMHAARLRQLGLGTATACLMLDGGAVRKGERIYCNAPIFIVMRFLYPDADVSGVIRLVLWSRGLITFRSEFDDVCMVNESINNR